MISALVMSICCVQKRSDISDKISMLVFNATQVLEAMKENQPAAPLVIEYTTEGTTTRRTDVKVLSPSTMDAS